jgi:1,2-phenylacetyl-CoA epoxidase PaaB subunit
MPLNHCRQFYISREKCWDYWVVPDKINTSPTENICAVQREVEALFQFKTERGGAYLKVTLPVLQITILLGS